MNILSRIQMVMDFYEWRRSDLAKAMSMSTASVSLLFKRGSSPSYESILALAKSAPDISISWLMTGQGNMRNNPAPGYLDIPISGDIAAGYPSEIYDLPARDFVSIPANMIAGQVYAFRVNGDSMAPHIIHGDIVIVEESTDPWSLDGHIVACRIDQDVTLKKMWINTSASQTVLLPFNSARYSPIVLSEDSPDCRLIGSATSIIRSL